MVYTIMENLIWPMISRSIIHHFAMFCRYLITFIVAGSLFQVSVSSTTYYGFTATPQPRIVTWQVLMYEASDWCLVTLTLIFTWIMSYIFPCHVTDIIIMSCYPGSHLYMYSLVMRRQAAWELWVISPLNRLYCFNSVSPCGNSLWLTSVISVPVWS